MKRILFGLCIFCIMLVAVPVFAQSEATPAPVVSDNGLLYILFTVIILALLATVTIAGPKLVGMAADNAPSWVVDALVSAINTLLDNAAQYAATTEVTYDDEAVAELKAKVLALEEQIKAGRGAMKTSAPLSPQAERDMEHG